MKFFDMLHNLQIIKSLIENRDLEKAYKENFLLKNSFSSDVDKIHNLIKRLNFGSALTEIDNYLCNSLEDSPISKQTRFRGDTFLEEQQTYENYNGSYAQDEEHLSDQLIDDAFEGDPDNYWNIE